MLIGRYITPEKPLPKHENGDEDPAPNKSGPTIKFSINQNVNNNICYMPIYINNANNHGDTKKSSQKMQPTAFIQNASKYKSAANSRTNSPSSRGKQNPENSTRQKPGIISVPKRTSNSEEPSRRVVSENREVASIPMLERISLDDERTKLIKYNLNYSKVFGEIPPTSLEHYTITKLIGKGAFAKVSLGIHKLTGKYVAIKTINKAYFNKDSHAKNKVLQEVYIHKKMPHPNVIKLFEVFEGLTHLFIVMEFASNGDLLQYVKGKGRLSDNETRTLFYKIIYGLAYIHSKSVIHRDIKLDNIFLDEHNNPKIGDFGVSKIINKDQWIEEQCGTPAYLAPEIVKNIPYRGFYSDHWSLGVVLYAMACAAVPYKAENLPDLAKVIESAPLLFPCKLTPDLAALIRKLLQIDPLKRPSIPEVLAHPWMKGNNSEGLYMTAEDCLKASGYDKKEEEKEIQGPNINIVNVANLFYGNEPSGQRILVHDFRKITANYLLKDIDEGVLNTVVSFGYDKTCVSQALKNGDINHATATYYLLLTDKNSQ